MPIGTATLDFGAFPGSAQTEVDVTGQAGIHANALVEAWVRPVATADHSAEEHLVESLRVVAGNIVAGTGFTIYGFSTNNLPDPGTGNNLLVYGQWTVAWAWL